MKSILEELNDIKMKKHVVTAIEYDCKTEQGEDEVFTAVSDILKDQTDAFSKITYDIDPGEHKVKVEVTQNKA